MVDEEFDFLDGNDVEGPVSYTQTKAILQHAPPGVCDAWVKALREAAPEVVADLGAIRERAPFDAGFIDEKTRSDALQREFDALPDDIKLLHYMLAQYCTDAEGAGDTLRRVEGNAAGFFQEIRALTLHWLRAEQNNQTAARINHVNQGTLVLQRTRHGTLGVYDSPAAAEPRTYVSTIQLGGRTIPVSLLIQAVDKYGTDIIPDTEVTGDVSPAKQVPELSV